MANFDGKEEEATTVKLGKTGSKDTTTKISKPELKMTLMIGGGALAGFLIAKKFTGANNLMAFVGAGLGAVVGYNVSKNF